MYNLTVAQAHNFFVGTGRWLVHNAGCSWARNLIDNRGVKHRGLFPATLTPNAVLYRIDAAGDITAYAVYNRDGLMMMRVDLSPTSATHAGIPPPHTHRYHYETHIDRSGVEHVKQVETTYASYPDEIP
jgi:hypothetical protein